MSLLFSNFPPIRTDFPRYTETFKDLLRLSDKVQIATGFISSDSVIDIKNIVDINGGPKIDLCIGMHYFEGLTSFQKEALDKLNSTLKKNNLGNIYMVTTFPFHGKIVSFSKQNSIIGSIIGSSNLSNIVEGQRQYEADYLIESRDESNELKKFIEKLIALSSAPMENLEIKTVLPSNNLLDNQLGVQKVGDQEVQSVMKRLSKLNFKILLKGDESPKSNLNVYFGEGRKNQQGFIIPRPWYEVELIVPKSITQLEGYPRGNSNTGIFNVITDDGWNFKCKVSGDYDKNFRSYDDLKILGKWIKGRLENSGSLRPGEAVTDETFKKYGRSDIMLSKITDSNDWYLDFGVSHNA